MPKKPAATLGIIYRMPLEDLHPHPLNPYGVRDDPAMQELVGSVKENGILIPAIARPRKEGGYELISGHRRKYACEQLGQDTMPVMVLNLKDDDAIIRMIDSNIQRENILPSERAKAYKLKMEAVKRKAGRPQKDDEKNSPKISANFRSDDSIGDQEGISGDAAPFFSLAGTAVKASETDAQPDAAGSVLGDWRVSPTSRKSLSCHESPACRRVGSKKIVQNLEELSIDFVRFLE